MSSARRIINNGTENLESSEITSYDEKFKISHSRDHEWTNCNFTPLKLPIICKVPENILIMIRTIENKIEQKLNNKLEFGGFLQGKFQSGVLIIEKNITIVKQKVTYASIDFEEEPPLHYNGVIHRHPSACKNFSSVDDGSINQNYEFSLLYCDNEIVSGIYNVKIGDAVIQLPLKIEIIYPSIENLDFDTIINNIHSSSPVNNHNDMVQNELPSMGEHSDLLFEQENDNFENLYACHDCNKYQKIYSFPVQCVNCNELICEEDAIEISDLDVTELDISQMNQIKSHI